MSNEAGRLMYPSLHCLLIFDESLDDGDGSGCIRKTFSSLKKKDHL